MFWQSLDDSQLYEYDSVENVETDDEPQYIVMPVKLPEFCDPSCAGIADVNAPLNVNVVFKVLDENTFDLLKVKV